MRADIGQATAMTKSGPVKAAEQAEGPEADARKALVKAALHRVGSAKLPDLLSFLKVADVARGSGLARFYKLFPKGEDGPAEDRPAGRDALVQAIENQAIDGKVWLEVTQRDAMRLPLLARDRDEEAFRLLRELATGDVEAYSDEPELRGPEVLRSLMAIAAHAGDQYAQDRLRERYGRIEPMYATFYRSLLEEALGRRAIPGIDTMEGLGLVIAALFDGLVLQHSFDDDEAAIRLAEATIVPLLGALTYPKDAPPPTDADHLYPPEPATASYGLTPPHLRPLPLDALADLVGTWQGTTRPADKESQPNTYLVLSDSEARLRGCAVHTRRNISCRDAHLPRLRRTAQADLRLRG